MSNIVGDRIRKVRKQKGVSVAQLAEKIGVTRSTLYRYENGEINKFPVQLIPKIAEALHVSPELLYGWTDNSPLPRRTMDTENVGMTELWDKYCAASPEQQKAVNRILKC